MIDIHVHLWDWDGDTPSFISEYMLSRGYFGDGDPKSFFSTNALLAVMDEAGVDISSHKSQHVDEFAHIKFDYVITLCDNAREQCPLFAGDVKLVHRAFKDPVMMKGTDDEIIAKVEE